MKRSTITRVITFTTGVAIGLNLITGAAYAAPLTTTDAEVVDVVTTEPVVVPGTVAATFRCTAVDVSSSRYDLSNVVLRFADGTEQRFLGLSGLTATFSGTGTFAGKVVETVFIKAGDNGSGEGPGYGERIDAATDTCTPVVVVPVTCPDGSTMATDTNGDGVINASDCKPVVVVVEKTCPDGSAMPATDQDGNGVINAADCKPADRIADEDVVVVDENIVVDENVVVVVDEDVAAGEDEVVPTIATDAKVTPPMSTTRPVLARPVVVLASVAQPATRAETPAEVLGATFDREVVPEVAVPETAVLGAQFNRSAPALAATGAGDVSNTATLALIFIALGFALVLFGRRPQAA